ncbi:hypothetical protein AMECASPLE_030935 [Ameca splendens]|uniref:Uncharacterized protein n=1 Tax=Ameca splendens TaxID=208324 RepID=A0ABV0YHX8_9TELE
MRPQDYGPTPQYCGSKNIVIAQSFHPEAAARVRKSIENSATDRSLCLIDHRLRALAVKSFSLEKTCRNSSSNSEKVQPKSKQLEKRPSAHLKAFQKVNLEQKKS